MKIAYYVLFVFTLAISLLCAIPGIAQVTISVNVDGQRALNGVAPPDPNAACGPNYIVEYVNTSDNLNIYDKNGSFISGTNGDAFFGYPTGGDGHVIYNENSGRFAAEELSTNGVVFAVSDTSDPRGSWHKIYIGVPGIWDGYGGNGIGYNGDAYVVHVNGFNNQFAVIASSNNVSLAYTLISAPSSVRIGRPVPMAGATPGGPFYFVEGNSDGANGTGGTFGVIEVVAVSNILSSPTYTDYQVPLGGPIQSASVFNTSWRSNQLAVVGPVDPGVVRWYLLDTSSGISFLQGGIIVPPDGGGVNDPSIAVAPNGSLGVNYVSVSSAKGSATATYVAGRAATDPVGTMRPSLRVVVGAVSDGRYGDYTSCVMDINSAGVAQNTFWICNEYFNSANQFDWRTRLANFSVPLGTFAPPPTGLTATGGNAQVTLNWTASPGATSYRVKRATVDGGPYTTLATTSALSFFNSGLANGVIYYYVVSAVNGSGEGANSSQINVTPQASTVTVFGFEQPAIGSGNFQYSPAATVWTYSGASPSGSGIVGNGSGFGNPNAPEGVQAAFVQENGAVSQLLSGFSPGTTYTITYSAAQRSTVNVGGESWNVTIDGGVIKSNNVPGATFYSTFTASFTASATTHTLGFVGTDLAGGDNTVFLDNVRITPAIHPVAPVVTLTAPTNNATSIVPPALSLMANVASNGNIINNVQFYYGANNLIGQVANPPYNFNWMNPATGTYSVFARVNYNGGSVVDSPAAVITVINTNVNLSFETPSIGFGNYQYNPSGGSWTFSGAPGNGSGLIANGSGFSNPNAPQGVQAAFVQGYGTLAQLLNGFTPGTIYTITYSAAQRSGASQHGGESWKVMIDNTVITNNNPGGTSYATYTATFTASAFSHTLSFVGTDLAGGDNTVFLDNVRFSPTISPVPPSVTLTSPANNSVFSAANAVNLAATVTTNGNSIVGVQFYSNGSNLIAQVTAPYTYAWSNADAGASTVLARLVFNGSNTVDSSTVNITITNPPPVLQGIGLGTDGQTLTVSGTALASRPYYLNTTTNLTSPVVWTLIQTNLSDGAGNIFFTNIPPTNAQQFFIISAP
ncbi:MAG TPA: Ig-like domain-containing protein [Verrucomicrobiae bacterium]